MIGSQLILRQEVGSTNSFASELLEEDAVKDGTVIVAGYQSRGRGHGKNNWHSERDKNLLLSIILLPDFLRAGEQFLISEFISLGLCDFLSRELLHVSIKWPNDILVGSKKIGGILIENAIEQDHILHSIAGIGLNVNQVKFPKDVPNATSMRQITGKEYDPERVRQALLNALDCRYEMLRGGNYEISRADYRKYLYRLNILSTFKAGDREFKAWIYDIDPSGELILHRENGQEERFGFKEVEFMD